MKSTNWIEYRKNHPGTPEEIVRRSQPPIVRAILDGTDEEYLTRKMDEAAEKAMRNFTPTKRGFFQILFS